MKFLILSLGFVVIFNQLLFGSIRVSLGEYLVDDDLYTQCLKVGKDGKIYIADKKNFFIRVFSEDGKYLYSLGGYGEGPGQFQRWFGAFDIDDKGNVFQVDFFNGNKRITKFLPDGKTVKTFQLQSQKMSGGIYIFTCKNGDLIIGKSTDLLIEKNKQLSFMGFDVEFVTLKPGDPINKKLFKDKLYLSFSDSLGGGWPNIPLAPFLLSAFHASTDKLIYQKTNSDRLSVLNVRNGKKIEIQNGFDKKAVSTEDLNEWLEEKRTNHQKFRAFEPLYKDYMKYGSQYISGKPIIDRIFFNPEGGFFVVAYDKKKRLYTVNKFSRESKLVRKAVFKRIPRYVGSDKLYYLDYDEVEDNYYLVIEKRKGTLF